MSSLKFNIAGSFFKYVKEPVATFEWLLFEQLPNVIANAHIAIDD
jgi:hypothetical protein